MSANTKNDEDEAGTYSVLTQYMGHYLRTIYGTELIYWRSRGTPEVVVRSLLSESVPYEAKDILILCSTIVTCLCVTVNL